MIGGKSINECMPIRRSPLKIQATFVTLKLRLLWVNRKQVGSNKLFPPTCDLHTGTHT